MRFNFWKTKTYVVYKDGDYIKTREYTSKKERQLTTTIYSVVESSKQIKVVEILPSNVIADDVTSLKEATTIVAIFRTLYPFAEAAKKVSGKLETLEKAQETLQNKVEVIQGNSLPITPDAGLRLTNNIYGASSMATSNNEDIDKVYVVVGKYPKYQVVKKLIKAEDENNYCLEDISLSTGPILSMHPKNMCFGKYEEAFNKVLQLIQEKSSKNYIKKGK